MGKPVTLATGAMHTTAVGLPPPGLPLCSMTHHGQRSHHRVDHPAGQAQNDAQASFLVQATLLNWLGQAPITFHRIYADITGSVVAGLWLSYALNKAARAKAREFDGDDFVFSMSARDCETATGITRGQQVSCRRALSQLGLLTEVGRQRKAPIYRLHMDQVASRMMRGSTELAGALASRATALAAPARISGDRAVEST